MIEPSKPSPLLSKKSTTRSSRLNCSNNCFIKLALVPGAANTKNQPQNEDFDFTVPNESSSTDNAALSAVFREVNFKPKRSLPSSPKLGISFRVEKPYLSRSRRVSLSSGLNLQKNKVDVWSPVSDSTASYKRLNSSIGPRMSLSIIPRVQLSERQVEPCQRPGNQKPTIVFDLKKVESLRAAGLQKVKTIHPKLSTLEDGGQFTRSDFFKDFNGVNKAISLIAWKNGSVYEGEVDGNQLHGEGYFRHFSGYSVKGIFRQGKVEGFAEYTHGNLIYSGQWSASEPHGTGKEVSKGVYSYEGDYCRGLKSGRGTMTIFEKGTYTGTFKFNHFCGLGFFQWKDGRLYVGQWKDSKMHGQGKMKWPDGRYYEGSYVDNLKEGNGTFRWADGRIYSGMWSRGLQEGTGKYISLDGLKTSRAWIDALKKTQLQSSKQTHPRFSFVKRNLLRE